VPPTPRQIFQQLLAQNLFHGFYSLIAQKNRNSSLFIVVITATCSYFVSSSQLSLIKLDANSVFRFSGQKRFFRFLVAPACSVSKYKKMAYRNSAKKKSVSVRYKEWPKGNTFKS
jgi:hypothetical protein